MYLSSCGPGSSVNIATGYGPDGPGIESRWGARFSAPVEIGPGAHPASCTIGNGSFPRIKSGRGVTLTSHPLLMPRSRKCRAIPLLTLRALRPVQRFSACTKVHFTFYLSSKSHVPRALPISFSSPHRPNKILFNYPN
jgi:hypothetical protein